MKSDFISMAGDDVDFTHLDPQLKKKAEFTFLQRAMRDAPNGIHQGMYVITPSGKYITGISMGWPHADMPKMNAQLKAALDKYKDMSKSERLGTAALKDSDLALDRKKSVIPPESWLNLSNISRVYPFPGVEKFDIRHPQFTKIDKLWYDTTEMLGFVPSKLKVGYSEMVNKDLINRYLNRTHHIASFAAWAPEHTLKDDISMTVKKVKGNKALIHYSGQIAQHANTKWNKSSYKGDVLGKAVWNQKSQQFESFQWIALGVHTLKELQDNMHRGDTMAVTIASKINIDPEHKSKSNYQLGPMQWHEYPQSMRDEVENK